MNSYRQSDAVYLMPEWPRLYWDGRATFLARAECLGGMIVREKIGNPDSIGRQATLDVAIFGTEAVRRCVVVSAGVHGVEGPFGSAVLGVWLRTRNASVLCDCRLVLIHAVNPWGWIHGRRWNSEGVDLNRNFLLAGETYAGCPSGYADALHWFLPKSKPVDELDATSLGREVTAFLPQWREILPVGQYDYEKGLFYGGCGPSPEVSILSRRLGEWIGRSHEVTHVDLHTGLGERGDYLLLIDEAEKSVSARRIRQRFQREPSCGSVGAYTTRGSWEKWCKLTFPDRTYDFVTAEFGTESVERMIGMLIRENQAWYCLDSADPLRIAIQGELQHAYCPADSDWRQAVLDKALKLLDLAIG
jgi:predicted deacylase